MATLPRKDSRSCTSSPFAVFRRSSIVGVHQTINAADKEAGYAGDAADILARFQRGFQAIEVGFSHRDVSFLGKEQSDVDVQAFADKPAHRLYALRRAGNFNHDVGAIDGLPQAARLFNGALRVTRQRWRYLKAHIAVAAVRGLINGQQFVSGVLNVTHDDAFVNLTRGQALFAELGKKISVIIAAAR